jgi:hypothetical protein
MDSFAEAAAGPTRQELTESRAAVAEASSGQPGFWSSPPESDIETFGLQKGRPYQINSPQDFKPGDRKRAKQQLIPTQDKKDHIRSRLGKHVAPALPESDVAEGEGMSRAAKGSDKTAYPNATVIKSKNGRPIGEIYQDEPYGWGAYHYGADNGADSMSSREQALAQLKDMHDEYRQKGVTETHDEEDSYSIGGDRYGTAEMGDDDEQKEQERNRGEMEEGMSRAAKGYEKYGRAGMAALARAGREGRALDPVRDRYDRYDEAVEEGGEFPSALWVRSNMNISNDQAHLLLYNFAKKIAAQHGLQDKVEKIYSLAQQAAISSEDHTAAGAKFKQLLKKYLDQDVSEGSAGEELKAIDGDYYEDSTDFFSMFEQDHFDREEESEDGMEIRGYIDDKCVMVFKYSTPDMMGGWGNYDDSALIAESGVEDDDEEGETCPECDGAGCPECYGDEDRDRAHDHAQGTQRESAGMAEGADGAAGVKYGVFAKGGSVGSQRFRDDPLKTFDSREEAVADARRRRSGLSKGERGYYRMGYVVKPIKGEVEEGMIDSIKNTVRAANYDRLARRSNSQAVAGGGFAPPAQFKSLSAKGDQRAQKAQDIRKGSAEQVDEIDMGLVGDAVAGAAMGLGSVGLGSYIGHKFGNKIGQKFIDRSNRKEAERQAKYDREEWRSHRSEIDEKSEAIRHGNNSRSIYHVDESVDPIEQLRADIRRFAQ